MDSNNNYPLEIVLAILNSKLATFYHFNHSPKATKGAFPKILVKDLKEFPLPLYDKDIFDYKFYSKILNFMNQRTTLKKITVALGKGITIFTYIYKKSTHI